MSNVRTFAFALLVAITTAGLAADWPRFRGPEGSGRTSERLELLQEPEELWTSNVGQGSASFAVVKDRLYTVGRDGGHRSLRCLDANTGRERWSVRLDSWFADSTPAVVGDHVYVVTSLDRPVALCLNAEDGTEVWRRDLPRPAGERHYGHAGSPLVVGDRIVVNAGLGVALDRRTGEVEWSFDGLPGLATPVLFEHDEQPAVAVFGGREIVARDLASGNPLWSIPWRTNLAVNACDPIVHDGKLFLCTDYGKFAAMFDLTTDPPKQLWWGAGSAFSSGFRSGNELYYFAGGHVVCRDWNTGDQHWRGPHLGGGSMIATPQHVIAVTDKGEIVVAPLSADGFEPVLREKVLTGTTWTPPALSNGRLYVRNKEGAVVCLRIGRARS